MLKRDFFLTGMVKLYMFGFPQVNGTSFVFCFKPGRFHFGTS